MKTTKQILPGVKFIGWVYAHKLIPDITLRGIARMPVPIFTDIHEVQFFDDPKCECVTTNDNGHHLDTVTLKFASEDVIPTEVNIALIVTDIDGNSYIIGSRDSPYTVIKRTISLGVRDGDAAGVEYEITHKAIKSLIPCDI